MQDQGSTDAGLPPPFSAKYVSDDLYSPENFLISNFIKPDSL